MAKKPNFSVNINMLLANLKDRESANPETLSRSYGVPVNLVREQMRLNGVREDGE